MRGTDTQRTLLKAGGQPTWILRKHLPGFHRSLAIYSWLTECGICCPQLHILRRWEVKRILEMILYDHHISQLRKRELGLPKVTKQVNGLARARSQSSDSHSRSLSIISSFGRQFQRDDGQVCTLRAQHRVWLKHKYLQGKGLYGPITARVGLGRQETSESVHSEAWSTLAKWKEAK